MSEVTYTNPECPYCTGSMDLVSKDGQWHICSECFTQEPRDTTKPRYGREIKELEDA